MDFVLKINKLSLKYKDAEQAVIQNLNLDLKKGEVLAIMGPSGCGKTTLLSFLQKISLDKIESSGKIIMNKGLVIRTVFQEPRLLPWKTVKENLLFVVKNKSQFKLEIEKALKTVKLEQFSNYYPSKLSVGMKQRVNFARALISKPDLLLLDEPFSSLDYANKIKIIKEFKNIIKENNISVIFVTHNIAEGKLLGDRIINLRNNEKRL